MSRSSDFRDLLRGAHANSQILPGYSEIMKMLGGSPGFAGELTQITLTAPSRHAWWRSIEDGVRAALEDNREERHPDAKLGSMEIEVKYKPNGFSGVPSDYYGVKRNKNKWYLLVSGDLHVDVPHKYGAYLIRSDEYYEAVNDFKKTSDANPPIDPDAQDAFVNIKKAIDDVSIDLAQSILKRSRSEDPEDEEKGKTEMSLRRRVGVNRIRIEIKFESLLRNAIRELLRS